MTHLKYPNESAGYRKARNALLAEEIALRRHSEAVAAQRRALPPGGKVPEDYVFERIGENGAPDPATPRVRSGAFLTWRPQDEANSLPSLRIEKEPLD